MNTDRRPPKEWIQPPKLADPRVTSSIARQGMIGRCLQEALGDVMTEDAVAAAAAAAVSHTNNTSNGEAVEDDAASERTARGAIKMQLDQPMVDNVMKEFGHAVARTKYTQTTTATSTKERPRKRHDDTKKKNAPAALLRGRVDHYNRLNGKWRVVVQDVQLKRRSLLERHRRKNPKPPLWDLMEDPHVTRVPATVQILAYDDNY